MVQVGCLLPNSPKNLVITLIVVTKELSSITHHVKRSSLCMLNLDITGYKIQILSDNITFISTDFIKKKHLRP